MKVGDVLRDGERILILLDKGEILSLKRDTISSFSAIIKNIDEEYKWPSYFKNINRSCRLLGNIYEDLHEFRVKLKGIK